MNKKLSDELSTFSLYKRETIIKNKWNSYNEVGIVVRLHYDLNSNIRLEGFIHFKDVSRPRWKGFMFINRK